MILNTFSESHCNCESVTLGMILVDDVQGQKKTGACLNKILKQRRIVFCSLLYNMNKLESVKNLLQILSNSGQGGFSQPFLGPLIPNINLKFTISVTGGR